MARHVRERRALRPTLVLGLLLSCSIGSACFAAELGKPSITDQPGAGSPAPAEPHVRILTVSPAPPGKGDPPPRASYGAWQIHCQKAPQGKAEQCALMQAVVAAKPAGAGLTAIILRTADKKDLLLRILAPSGVLLPSGIGLTIDGKDLGRTSFVRCLPNGCVAEVLLDKAILDTLKAGKTATFIVFERPEEGIGIPISLAGFASGVGALP
jgi:invasion protein IalB